MFIFLADVALHRPPLPPPEIKEMGEFADADVIVPSDEAVVDPASQAILDESGDKNALKNVGFIQEYAQRPD